ncbi:MAG: type III pantothenate kinase [Bacteroidales bacterium]|jgi:type III pantothenate kinase|nr:type III pantothenate kinase [Bacteroidales bacterium]
MNLVIDRGNTKDKVAVFSNTDMIFCERYDRLSLAALQQLKERFPMIKNAVYCSVMKDANADVLISFLKSEYHFVESEKWKTGINVLYRSKETLGQDRMAAMVGANALYHNMNTLVVDCGSCITFDAITALGDYLGGSISCGLRMKFSALHNFTANLPLINVVHFSALIGTTTEESILSGVINGTLEEVEGMIKRYMDKFEPLNVVLSGGDAEFISKSIKVKHTLETNLVLFGLNNILLNENKKTNN